MLKVVGSTKIEGSSVKAKDIPCGTVFTGKLSHGQIEGLFLRTSNPSCLPDAAAVVRLDSGRHDTWGLEATVVEYIPVEAEIRLI